MIASRPSSVGDGGKEQRVSGFVGALWLAKKEMKGTWLSYPLGGLFVVFVGLLAVAGLSGVFELKGFGAWGQGMEDYYNSFFLDYLFLAACALLGVNMVFFSGGRGPLLLSSWDSWPDTSSSRGLLLLRGLPISAGSLVGSRMISMLLALMVNAGAFFVPVFLLSDLGRELGTTAYLWFAGIWVGYALCASGLCLLCELTLGSDKGRTLFSFGLAGSLMVVVLLIEWALEPGLVERTAKLAQMPHGALFAILCVVAGGMVLALLCRLTARCLKKRELSTKDLSS
jgi:hypothetical protein